MFSLNHIRHIPNVYRRKTYSFKSLNQKCGELISSPDASLMWNEFDMFNFFSQVAEVLVPSLAPEIYMYIWFAILAHITNYHQSSLAKLQELLAKCYLAVLSVSLQNPPINEKNS